MRFLADQDVYQATIDFLKEELKQMIKKVVTQLRQF